jgi:ATP phosphoribosyltransferase regulatory subunit
MMGLRADITPQIARIATTRLSNAPRPLRVSYAGQVLRVKGSQLRPERQFAQAGFELIGAGTPAADAEVVVLAAEALERLGIEEVSVDLTLPTLVSELLASLGVTATPGLRDALDHKDVASVRTFGGAAAPALIGLIEAVGPADRALSALAGLDLPPPAAEARRHLERVVELARDAAPGLRLTIDPVENRGFEYHSGVSFTIFARGAGGELGRGGRYLAGGVEPATGATLFLDTVLGAMPRAEASPRVFVPFGTPSAETRRLREQGWAVVSGLDEAADYRAEAKRLGCGNVLEAGQVLELE